MNRCPACSAPLGASQDGHQIEACAFCGWNPPDAQFPVSDPELAQQFTDETVPLPDSEAEALASLPTPQGAAPTAEDERTGPEHFRELLHETGSDTRDLMEQVPEEMREVLEDRMRSGPDDNPGFRSETIEQLRGSGYFVTEDSSGARISAVPQANRKPDDLSPTDVVKMAAELEGGVKPKTELPMCGACQSASPVGSTTCQWCGEPL